MVNNAGLDQGRDIYFTSMAHRLQKYLLQWRARKLCANLDDQIANGDKLLDLGAGDGYVGKQLMSELGADTTLLDINNNNRTDLPLIIYSGKELRFKDREFDSVLISYVLHHTVDPVALLKEAKRVTRNKIIILEDVYKSRFDLWIVTLSDHIMNVFNETKTYGFKREDDWRHIFKSLGLVLVDRKQIRTALDPVCHLRFTLRLHTQIQQEPTA